MAFLAGATSSFNAFKDFSAMGLWLWANLRSQEQSDSLFGKSSQLREQGNYTVKFQSWNRCDLMCFSWAFWET